MPGGVNGVDGKDGGSVRDTRGKAKQFMTVNGRTVVVKDTFVYSNKGASIWGSTTRELSEAKTNSLAGQASRHLIKRSC